VKKVIYDVFSFKIANKQNRDAVFVYCMSCFCPEVVKRKSVCRIYHMNNEYNKDTIRIVLCWELAILQCDINDFSKL